MTVLLTAHSLSKSYGTQSLFQEISFTICRGDRLGLIGPNGSGKSTLLKIIHGLEDADSGHISRRQNLKVGYASQAPEFPADPVEQILVNEGVHLEEHERQTHARCLLSKAQFADFSQSAHLLSGGWKKRLDIAKALMIEPDLLLLDEPTNHLDLEGIEWLEALLKRQEHDFLVVSHDRYFLENVCNKIIELDKSYPQGLFMANGSMSVFMERKQAFLEAQLQKEKGLSSTVRYETEWLKKSAPARTTKSRSRIQKAYLLIEELEQLQRMNTTHSVGIQFTDSELMSRKLLAAKKVVKSYGDKILFKGIDLILSPGSRLGVVGKNGTGKTTLLKILSGQMQPDSGTIKYADGVKIVFFDQHREQIPLDISLKEALCPVGEMVSYQGQFIHVNGWAKKFLFHPDRLKLPVKCLSGGERARILIARLMMKPADILFLDEPTNDLDIATLEVIEESLKEFRGAVVLITHDRCLMDRVCTQIVGLGQGNEMQLFADFDQWEEASQTNEKPKEKNRETARPAAVTAKKLSYHEKKELEGMEAAITALEAEIKSLQILLESPHISNDPNKAFDHYRLLDTAQKKLEERFVRWQYLDSQTK